jgi:uncharacterized lipoprotein YddW (UPF0748 family)
MRRPILWPLLLLLLCLGGLRPLRAETPLRPETVEVGHQRELRGVWVASVGNMHFPSRPGLTPAQARAELERLVERVADCGLNTIFFQVRPEGDALYESALEPWSRYLTGQQGQAPGYDPLATLIDLARPRGLEVHAWLNPYRASAKPWEQSRFVAPPLGATHPESVKPYGSFVWMEPTDLLVRQRLVAVCRDLATRYDLDGLHFDDYFYPYPEGERDFPDEVAWQHYHTSGGELSRGDWRRQHVNRAVAEVSLALRQTKPHLRFGISPFGLPAPDRPAGILGFDQYHKLYADPQTWSDRGYVDYLAPQLYWPTTRREQALEPLLYWWTDHALAGRYTFPGLNLNGLGSKPEWNLAEYSQELHLLRGRAERGARGAIWWSVAPLLENRQGVVEHLARLYPTPALPPALFGHSRQSVAPPRVYLGAAGLRLEHRDAAPLRGWAIYQQRQGRWQLLRFLPAGLDPELPPGRYAIAAVTRFGSESHGQIVELR